MERASAGDRTKNHLGQEVHGSPIQSPNPLLCVLQNLRPFSNLDLMSPMLGVAPEHTRQLLLEGPARVKEGREGKVREHG